MNTAPAPNSLALSAGSSRSSHVPSATRYHAIAAGSATAQNKSSTRTYDATPAVPNSFTCANPLFFVSSFATVLVRSESKTSFSFLSANRNAAQMSVGAAIIVSALSYDGSKKKSPASVGVATHAVELNTTNDAKDTIEESVMPPPLSSTRTFSLVSCSVSSSSSSKVVVFSFSLLVPLRSTPFRYTENAATAHPALPRNVRSACSGTSALTDGSL